MKIVNELSFVVTHRTPSIEVTAAHIEQFKAYQAFAFTGQSEDEFLGYLPKVLRYVHAHPDHRGKGAPDIAFEWLKTLSTDVVRKDAGACISERPRWTYPRFVGLNDSGVLMNTRSVDAFEVAPNADSEVFAIKCTGDGKYYQFYYSVSEKFKAENENIKNYFSWSIEEIKNNYTGEKVEKSLRMEVQSKQFNDFTNIDIGGSETVLCGFFENKGPIEPLITQFMYMLGGRADLHSYVSVPESGGRLVERSENDESPIVLDNYRHRLSSEEIAKLKEFRGYFSDYSDKRVSFGVWWDIKFGSLSADSVNQKRMEEEKKKAEKAAEDDAVAKARVLIPLTEHDFIKAYFTDADERTFDSGFLGEGLEEFRLELNQMSRSDLKSVTKTTLEAKAFWHIGKAAINIVTGNIKLRDTIFDLINRKLAPEDRIVGKKMKSLCRHIAESRGWMIRVKVTKASDYKKRKKDGGSPITLIPTPLIQAALDEFHDWAANLDRSDLVLIDNDHVQDSVVLINMARRVLAYVPSKTAREKMIEQINSQPFLVTKLDGQRLVELALEAKGLRRKDSEQKKQPKYKYQLNWSQENVDKDRRDHSSKRYKTLAEAKKALCDSYVELRNEINEGGGYFDNHENEIWISDDGMRFRSSGLVFSDFEIHHV